MSKRILLWTSSYPPVLGGLQTLVSQLAEGLVLKGQEVLVLTNRYPLNLKANEIINGVNVRRILRSQKDLNGISGLCLAIALLILEAICQEQDTFIMFIPKPGETFLIITNPKVKLYYGVVK